MDLHADDIRLRVLEDPTEGYAAVLLVPGFAAMQLGPEQCALFSAELERTDDRNDEIWLMQGAVELDCELTAGGVIFGRLSFGDCD